MIRFSMLVFALLFGSNAIQKAKLEVDAIRMNEMQIEKLRKNLTLDDNSFMAHTLDLPVSKSQAEQEHSARSLIVKDGLIVGEGWDQSKLLADPSAHATVMAVREACKNLSTVSLKGCVLYSSEEPCPMCLSLLYAAEVDKIVYSILSNTGPSVEQFVSEKVYWVLRQTKSERPIPEISFPQQKSDSTVRKGIGSAIY
jgi:guanine deaminase